MSSFYQYLTRKLLIHLSLTKLLINYNAQKKLPPKFSYMLSFISQISISFSMTYAAKKCITNVLQMFFFSISFSPLFLYSTFFHFLKYFSLLSIFLHYLSTFYFRGNLAILWNLMTVVLLFKCKCILIFKEKKTAQCACLSSIQILKSQVISWMVKQ